MKTKTDYCDTCGDKIIAAFDWWDFADPEIETAVKEAHCGKPGHNMYTLIMTREEFEGNARRTD